VEVAQPRYRLALDVGGTFTDFVLEDLPAGEVTYGKALTTPADPSAGIVAGLPTVLAAPGATEAAVREIVHATTVGANAIIERKGARTALVTTEGFRDVAVLGRQKRYETYDLSIDKPAPLVRRRDIVELAERVGPGGEVERAVEEPALADAARRLAAIEGLESVAVCLLHAYANGAHERRLADTLTRHLPGATVSLSSDVSPRRGEYERTSTTLADAYIKPIVARYLHRLLGELGARGFQGRFFMMQSNGGLSTPELAAEQPVRIVESGPTAGVLMAAGVGRRAGREDVLTFDMGGTTAKLGAVEGGAPATTDAFEIDVVNFRRGSGLPLTIPVTELLEIGAGGGSVARVGMGTIAVGPESAGSDPGPVCYGRGGALPTVTDANLLLGYLDPAFFLGGRMALDTEAADRALRAQVAEPLDLDLGRAAWGVHRVANAAMERALRIMSIERGRDPRRYALVAFGGAGPLHAARLARSLAIPAVLVPPGAGVGSALGLLAAPLRFDLTVTRPLALDSGAGPVIVRELAELRTRLLAGARLAPDPPPAFSHALTMRYRGQGHELHVDIPTDLEQSTAARRASEAFAEAYRRAYGYLQEDAPVEIVDWSVTARVPAGLGPPAGPGKGAPAGPPSLPRPAPEAARKGERPVYFPESDGYAACSVWDRYLLVPGCCLGGPAIVEERESTTVIPPGDDVLVDAQGNLCITIGGS
jgi:N-methylhydantoinase A/oxoprolinase/acetone carboxylase beta subunit